MTAHSPARRAALLAAVSLSLGACSPDVNEGGQGAVDSTAAGGTANRENTSAGINSTIAPPGQGSALSDTAAGRLAPAGVSGPTQGLTGAAPDPQNANAQTRAQTAGQPGDSAAPSRSAPRADAAPAPTKQP